MGLKKRHEQWHERHGRPPWPPHRSDPSNPSSPSVPSHASDPPRPPRPRPRGRPRSEAVERAITEAVMHLLEQGASITELSIERIARTAGVGKATIYRRWSGMDELLVEVISALEGPLPEPRGASVRDDLVTIVDSIRPRGLNRHSAVVLRGALTEAKRHPKLAAQYHRAVAEPRRRALREVIERGVANGELRADIDADLLMELFTGPMLVRTVLHEWAPLPEGFAARVVDAVLDGVRSPDR